jgi:hypothetical protein
VEIWWDKQFSTFMFRVIEPSTASIVGVLVDVLGDFLPNAKLELIAIKLEQMGLGPDIPTLNPRYYVTMTDDRGRFAFRNVTRPGAYQLTYGMVAQDVQVTRASIRDKQPISVAIKNAKRVLDIRRSSIWELMKALNASEGEVRRLQSAFKKAKKLDTATLEQILVAHKHSFKELQTRAVINL